MQLGITPAKSLTLQPWIGPSHLMRHYWRGVFDGDGCIHQHSRITSWSLTLVGSRPIVEAFAEWCKTISPCRSQVQQRNKIYAFGCAGTALPRSIACLLYKDSEISLERKKILADSLISTPTRKREKGAPARDKALKGPQKIGGHNIGKFSIIPKGCGPLFEFRQRNNLSQIQLGRAIGLSKESVALHEKRGIAPGGRAGQCFTQLADKRK